MDLSKPKAVVFFQYLPPWRIDVFNEMAKYYNLTIIYTNADIDGFKYDREELLNRLNKNIKNIFLNNGIKIGKRPIRFGIYKFIKSIKPTIIFSHEYTATSIFLATFLKLRLFNFQLVITTSDNLLIAKSTGKIKSYFRKYVLEVSKSIIVYSESVKQFYLSNFKDLRVEICPNIQNSKTLLNYRTSFPSIIEASLKKFDIVNKKLILFTGRLENVKGLDLLLKAFSKSKNINFKLVLVGEGSEKKKLQQQCKQLNIEDKVIFAGFYSGSELYAWYDLASFYILPSRFEPFGAVVNEALVYGCPVMASKYIGAVDFINETNGLLFDPLDLNEFISSLNIFYERCSSSEFNDRFNLMINSFEEYVKVFDEIFNESEKNDKNRI
tara:strand:- start:7246 stop:8391 length:1146 start_codon:yes stop_codon:yes gene_type:complete